MRNSPPNLAYREREIEGGGIEMNVKMNVVVKLQGG
jgi:hypothetical protein